LFSALNHPALGKWPEPCSGLLSVFFQGCRLFKGPCVSFACVQPTSHSHPQLPSLPPTSRLLVNCSPKPRDTSEFLLPLKQTPKVLWSCFSLASTSKPCLLSTSHTPSLLLTTLKASRPPPHWPALHLLAILHVKQGYAKKCFNRPQSSDDPQLATRQSRQLSVLING
jgi:hypothetical protein